MEESHLENAQKSHKFRDFWNPIDSAICPTFTDSSFETTVGYFGMKPKSGEKEITPSYVFMVWYEFCSDFKTIWKRESKNISKESWPACSPGPHTLSLGHPAVGLERTALALEFAPQILSAVPSVFVFRDLKMV
ncbi:riboflavin kinase [Saguinus oedipus]|uniref:Riboflavin kinase n=1 Tax=Saguinus oedipus TaxID=9490 RepID=A0ABQ9V3B0_SAGOE|nr:riboflavin kinase [Saguinus oedipus]